MSSWQLTLRQTLTANSNAIRFSARMGLLTLSGAMFALVPLLAQLEAGPTESDLTWIFITCVIVGSSGAICGVGMVKGFDRAIGTTFGAVLAIACDVVSSYLGKFAPYFVGVCIFVYCTTVFFMMEKHKADLGVHTYALMLSSLTFGLVLLDSYKIETGYVWRAGVWRTACIFIGCVLSLLFIAFFFPIRTLAVVHDTYCVILRQEADLLREIIHARARGDVKHSLRSIIYEGKDDDSIHKKYINITGKITAMSALIPNAQWELAYFSLDFDRRRLGDQRSYRVLSARLRRLATHVICMDEQLRIKPTPLPPNARTASKLVRIGNHIHDLLTLIALKLERVGRVSEGPAAVYLESSVFHLQTGSVRESQTAQATTTTTSAPAYVQGMAPTHAQPPTGRTPRESESARASGVVGGDSGTSSDGMLLEGGGVSPSELEVDADQDAPTYTGTGAGWDKHSTVNVHEQEALESAGEMSVADNDNFDAIWSARVKDVVEHMRVVAEGLVRKSGKQRFEDSLEHSERKQVLGRKYSVHNMGAWLVAGRSVAEAWRDQAGDLFTGLVVNATVQCMMVLQDAELLGELHIDGVVSENLNDLHMLSAGGGMHGQELKNIPEKGE
ncbi:hypothetical protein SARC_01288 [Sphaeroforma arctica JP610]|uniref:DUF2421 domain-containing protein n=1 Tax=Sphaeroforma arctica JP610 TaxID=667725 RepID=A0A0L0GC56_9EUKA|nr:hypothetical protein SARC_01288 [Sphaeroforma arctica JP610]KNC86565.1 hypothetical protein SARC_01288 [Sphaeroforma arctica JP610]|eukprot:XP_014160467.1 hypothetical protein SARC_01288 [Sphaeroforma arctica JP610]